MILLDTHIWIWWALGEKRLTDYEIAELDKLAQKRKIAISTISIWEVEILERKSKLTLKPNFSEWISKSIRPSVCKVLPIDVNVIMAQRNLPDSFHFDPADRLITATSMLAGIPLLTQDSKIIESGCCEILKL